MNSHATPAFGTFAPAHWQQQIIRLTRQLPDNWLGRRLALLLRKPVLKTVRQAPVDITLLGFRMRLIPFDNVSERRVMFTPHFFDHAELALLEKCITPNFQFVDVGANAGLYSLFIAARSSANARILAIEPQPDMLTRLRTNIALNNFEQVQVAPVAVSDSEGEAEFFMDATNRGGASLNDMKGASFKVKCRPLLTLLDEAGITQPDALKIDIEGYEDRVLGAFFKSAPKERWPRLIFMERNSHRWQSDIAATLLGLGYREQVPGRMNMILELTA